MNFVEFSGWFSQRHEIGREVTTRHFVIYYDNGMDVGIWREDRWSAFGSGEVLCAEDVEIVRRCYGRSTSPGSRRTAAGLSP